jgi:hypothetical protein
MRPQLQHHAKRRQIIYGFLAGALGVLTVHQGVLWALHATGFAPWPAYRVDPTRPFGVPQVLSAAFWGGLWGILIYPVASAQETRMRGVVVAGAVAALLPTLAGALLLGLRISTLGAAGLGSTPRLQALAASILVNGAWGASVFVIAEALGRRFLQSPKDA